jgi:hypothetical protein
MFHPRHPFSPRRSLCLPWKTATRKKKRILHIFTTQHVSNEKLATPTVVMVVPRVRKVARLSNAIQSFSQCDIRKHSQISSDHSHSGLLIFVELLSREATFPELSEIFRISEMQKFNARNLRNWGCLARNFLWFLALNFNYKIWPRHRCILIAFQKRKRRLEL